VTESADWDALRQLRMSGQKPALPVIVTTKPHLPKRLEGVGCLVILHKAGEVMPIKLLEGLDIIFNFDKCGLELHVEHMRREKGIKFGRTQVWCSCANVLSILPMNCYSHGEMIKWLEGESAA
jgi:hypothetical protein